MGILNLHKFRIFAFLALLAATPCFASAAHSVTPVKLQENKIKAGLVYNFLKYTEWPKDVFGKTERIQVCLLGGDTFEGALDPLAGRTAQQNKIVVRKIDEPADFTRCNLVVIHQSQEDNISEVINAFNGQNILTISDIKGFVLMGGMVEFFDKNDQRIHLRINSIAVKNAGLRIGDPLLKLAEGMP
jgi:hypothetical protein